MGAATKGTRHQNGKELYFCTENVLLLEAHCGEPTGLVDPEIPGRGVICSALPLT